MPKTARVPAALHGELTEYASLLRALRTSHALDLSTHLSQVPSNYEDEISDSDLSDDEHSGSAEDGTPVLEKTDQEPVIPLPSKKRKRTTTTTDTWTRWPLLAGDVYRPEWDLSDEVELLVSHIRQQQRAASQASSSSSEADLEMDETGTEQVGTRALAASTVNHLRSILSVCSAHVPRVEPTMRARLAPLNWTSVLAAAGASGFVPPETLARVRARLEALYKPQSSSLEGISQVVQRDHPPSPALSRPAHAASTVNATRAHLRFLLSTRVEQGDGDILSFMGPLPPPEHTAKRKQARRMKREMKLEKLKSSLMAEESLGVIGPGDQEEQDEENQDV